MEHEMAFGAINSPVDYRDEIASTSMAAAEAPIALPETFNTDLGPILHQHKIPSCVSHSVVYLLKLYWFQRLGQWIDFSPRFLDVLAKRTDGQPIDGGTYPRLLFKLAVKYGCATQATLKNDTLLSLQEYRNDAILTEPVFEEAEKWKIPGFIRTKLDIESVRRSIFLYGGVSTLFQIGSELWTPSYAKLDIDPMRTPQMVVSGHQMTDCGWTSSTLNTLQNEWGVEWADHGKNHYNVATWRPFTQERWSVASIPSNLKDFLASLPSVSDFHFVWIRDLKFGDRSEDVKFAQIALMILGFMQIVPAQELGIYGPKTSAAVSAYQVSKKIFPPAPNNIGPRTRAALNAQFLV